MQCRVPTAYRHGASGLPRTDVEVRVVDEDATAEALWGGWLHTGDVGSFDDEGYLTLRDRSRDLIISGGMNISPREIEEVLLRHPGVEAVAVVGRPDPEWGETVVAFVVGASDEPRPGVAELDPRSTASSSRCRRAATGRSSNASSATGSGARRPASRRGSRPCDGGHQRPTAFSSSALLIFERPSMPISLASL